MAGPDLPAPLSTRLAPTLGDQPWFTIPTRVAILLLGLAHLPLGLQPERTSALLLVLGLYGLLAASCALASLPQLRGRLGGERALGWARAHGGRILDFLVDSAFIVAVTAISDRPHTLLLPVLVMLAGARFFAGIIGPPTLPIVAPFLLPLVFALLPSAAGGTLALTLRLAEVALTVGLLIAAYLCTRKLNANLLGAVELAHAVAERDVRLDRAQRRSEEDAAQLAEQVLRLRVLQDGIAAVNSAIELPDLLEMVITNALRVLKAEQSSIGLIDERSGGLVIQAATGAAEGSLRRREFAPGVGVAGWVVEHGEPLLIGDVRLDSRYVPPVDEPSGGPTTRSMVCVPLRVERRVIGALSVTHSAPQAFRPDDQRWLGTFAEQAALAVYKTRLLAERTRHGEELRRRADDNARLLRNQSQQQQQAAALYRLMLKVSDARTRRQLAEVICQELQQITRALAAVLLIHDEEHSRLVAWAASGAWSNRPDVLGVSLAAHGDLYVSKILQVLQQRTYRDVPVFDGVPQPARPVFAGERCITVPLTLGPRIYGLLILKPAADPPIAAQARETVNLAVSHCAVALERAELFDQTLAAARQAVILQSVAGEVQTSLNPTKVVQAAAIGLLTALPIDSCEVYTFDPGRRMLRRRGVAVTHEAETGGWRSGPAVLTAPASPTLLTVFQSTGLVAGDVDGTSGAGADSCVLLGRLSGSEEVLGLVRLTTTLPAAEFVRRYAAVCQTLWMHVGGALDRSHLYTTAADQARLLSQRAQQLTDILNLGNLSAADSPLSSLLPPLAAGIARSLGFTSVRIAEVAAEPALPDGWPVLGQAWPGPADLPAPPLSPAVLDRLLAAGRAPGYESAGVYLDAAAVRGALGPEAPAPDMADSAILMPLAVRGSGPLGYLLALPAPETALAGTAAEHDLLEILAIFAQRIALIMENHRIYSQLLSSKRKIEAVVLSISDGIIVTDPDLNVLIANSLADQLLGSAAGESCGYPLARYIHNADLLTQVETCLASGKSTSADVELNLGRERHTYQAVVHSITAPDADSLGVVLTLRDVTLERATERAKSDFLSVVSHEMRTPLNSVMGFLDIILMGKTGPLTELQTDFLATARQESGALQRLIDDVLDYSQIQIHMLRLELVPMDLSAALTRVANQAVPRMATDELRLINNVPPRVLVVGDEVRLEQVFKNLLDNAAKFTDPGGEIRFDAHLDTDTVTITVSDTGGGIPAAQLPAVFDRFFQAENSSNRHRRGLGLGLAICKSIVDAHDGRIWIESEVGVGTTVSVELLRFRPDTERYDFEMSTGKTTLKAWR